MATDGNLQQRETARRKALWTLAHPSPGIPSASGVIAVLDQLDLQEGNDSSLPKPLLSIEAVRTSVPTVLHREGLYIVLEISNPQPWRERFLRASVGSTRLEEGPYYL